VFGGRIYFLDWLARIDQKDAEVHELISHLVEIKDGRIQI
jgi:hypothetical protein